MDLTLTNGRVLLPSGELAAVDLHIADGLIGRIGGGDGRRIDLAGRLVLPGIVDLHGDGFERHVAPRSNVQFPIDVAINDTASAIAANGITTAYLAQGFSWEGGPRGPEAALELIEALERRPAGGPDLRVHLRYEIFSVDDQATALEWIEQGRVHFLVFNDHVPQYERRFDDPTRLAVWTAQLGLSEAAFRDRLEAAKERSAEVGPSLWELASAATGAGVPLGSHDDESPAIRRGYAQLGVDICEFPTNAETAEAAAIDGNPVAMGAPNALRGGSASGNVSARAVIESDYCTYLASDYYYPAPLHAAFALARQDVLPFADAWELVSTRPAEVANLDDRGRLSEGLRADLVVVDDSRDGSPVVDLVFAAGEIAYARTGRGLLDG